MLTVRDTSTGAELARWRPGGIEPHELVFAGDRLIVALGGISPILHINSERAPLLVMPVLVCFLFYVRGLYRTKMRVQILDGIVPVLSGVSVAATRGQVRCDSPSPATSSRSPGPAS